MSETTGGAAGHNILIVDDSAMMRAMIRRVASLSEAPIGQVFEAANGAEALAILEREQVAAMFTDINMPVMTGTELLQEIERRGQWPHLVRVIVSTDGSQARRKEVDDLHVRCYVEKPFRPEVILDVFSALSADADSR